MPHSPSPTPPSAALRRRAAPLGSWPGRALGLALAASALGMVWVAGPPRPGVTAQPDGPAQPGLPTATATGRAPCTQQRLFLPFIQRVRGLPYLRPTAGPRLLGPLCPRSTVTVTPAGGASATATRTATAAPPGSPTASPSPGASGSPTVLPEASPTRPATVLGVQAFESDLTPLGRGLGDAVTWVRVRALWAAVEPADTVPPRLDWGMTDGMLGAVLGRQLTPVVVIYTAPSWAASLSCGPVDKAPLQRYQDFVRALVERYDGDGLDDAPGSPVVRHWEIGNEPDLSQSRRGQEDYGSCFGDSPAAYADQLREAFLGARAADPQAQILFGAVAYDRFYNGPEGYQPKGPFNIDFTRQVLEQLHDRYGQEAGWPFFQVMAFHNYNDFRQNWDAPDGSRPEIVGKAFQLREQQLRVPGKFDLRELPLFASEVGLPSAPSDAYTLRSEDYQAAYLGQVFSRAAAAGIRGAIWFTLMDLPPGAGSAACADPYAWLAHGLLRSQWMAQAAAACPTPPLPGYRVSADIEPKPAWQAIGTAARLLGGARFERRLDFAETGDLAIEAYRFRRPDGSALLVAFTDHGERLGKRSQQDLQAELTLDATLLPGWTGRLRVTDHLGTEQVQSGARIPVDLDHRPRYVEPLP